MLCNPNMCYVIKYDREKNEKNGSYVNDSLNQYYKRENVRISTVPEAEDEDLNKTLFEIADSVRISRFLAF
jgi:hypothetical protein